jgi:hypothetical protein
MPICIECRYPVPQLYHVLHSGHKPTAATIPPPANPTSSSGLGPQTTTNTPTSATVPTTPINVNGGARPGGESSKASGGSDVRLTQCPRCKRFADKYVEHDFVVLFIDLVLVKPQVYRHLLFNRLGRDDDKFDPSMKRLGLLLLLFDVYLTWSSIEALQPQNTAYSPIPELPIILQYAFYLALCLATTLAQHLTIRILARFSRLWSTQPTHSPTGQTPSVDKFQAEQHAVWKPNAISTALFVSSGMKLFPILMIVWRYDDAGGQVAHGVQWAVAVQNEEAIRILLGCSYWAAALLVTAGTLARWAVGRVILNMVGLESFDSHIGI